MAQEKMKAKLKKLGAKIFCWDDNSKVRKKVPYISLSGDI